MSGYEGYFNRRHRHLRPFNFTVATSYKTTVEEFFEKNAGEDAKMASKLLGINFNGLIKRKFPLPPALPSQKSGGIRSFIIAYI